MKKKLIFAIIGFTMIIAVLSAMDINKEFTFNEPTIKRIDNYDRITIEGLSYNYEPGHPEVPILPIQIAIPAGEEAVKVEISYISTESITGTYNVYPRQRPYPLSYEGEVSFVEPDSEIYFKNEL